MEILKVIIISIIHGVSEFLPVSSSGHIFLLKKLFNLDIGNSFDVFLHMGSLIAVIIFFRIEIYDLIKGLFKTKIDSKIFGNNLERKNIIKIWILFILATIPGAIAGVFLDKYIDIQPSSAGKMYFLILSGCFLLTAILLISISALKFKKELKITELSFIKAIFIGVFQAIGILPGISRSGITLTGSLYSGLNRNDSSRFAFMMSIPIITGASLFKFFKLIQTHELSDINIIIFILTGMLVSFVVGYFSLKFLIKIIQKGRLWFFSIYLTIPIIICLILAFK